VFDSRLYQIFWEVVGPEWDPLSLVSTIEELLGRKSSGSGLENRDYGRRDQSRWPRGTLYPQTLALTSPTSCGLSVGIVWSRTQTTEFNLVYSKDSGNCLRNYYYVVRMRSNSGTLTLSTLHKLLLLTCLYSSFYYDITFYTYGYQSSISCSYALVFCLSCLTPCRLQTPNLYLSVVVPPPASLIHNSTFTTDSELLLKLLQW
jgi:hypothetical protein